MRSIYIIGMTVLFVLIFSCKKRTVDPPQSLPDNTEIEIIWAKSFSDSNIQYMSIDPELIGDQVITSYIEIFSDESETIISLDAETGIENWNWQNFIRPGPQRVSGTQRIHYKDNIMTACSSQDNYAIDLNSGTTLWASNIEDGNPRTSRFDNVLFHTITYATAPYGDSSKIVMKPISGGAWRDIFQVNKTDQFEVNIEPPAAYINSDGDTLLIFQNRQITITPFEEKVDLYCYNMTQDSVTWFKSDLTFSGSSNVRAPLVEGDLVYFAGKWDFFCIDIPTGEVQWLHNFYHDFQGSNSLIYNDLIITNLDNGDLIAINKQNGFVSWVNVGLSGCCTELRIYNDRIYFGNDKLYIVDAGSGDLLYSLKSPNLGGSFKNGIAVNLVEKRMYTSDGYYIMCMKLPE
jgi:outer membrane protein assembly factor BamB